jgi:hypothetical protein
MGQHVARLDELIRERFPDVVVTHPGRIDVEGWLSYALSGGDSLGATFAGIRFRRDKSTALTVFLSVKPNDDPKCWAHESHGKVQHLPYSLGLPRPFAKDVSDDEWQYLLDLIVQAHDAEAAAQTRSAD